MLPQPHGQLPRAQGPASSARSSSECGSADGPGIPDQGSEHKHGPTGQRPQRGLTSQVETRAGVTLDSSPGWWMPGQGQASSERCQSSEETVPFSKNSAWGVTRWRRGGPRQGRDVNGAEEEERAQGCTREGAAWTERCLLCRGHPTGRLIHGHVCTGPMPPHTRAPTGKSSIAGPLLHRARASAPTRQGLCTPADATARHRAPKSSRPSPAFSLTHATKAISYRPCPRPRASLPPTTSVRQGTGWEPPR